MNLFMHISCILALLGLIQLRGWAQLPDHYVSNQPDSAAAYWRLRAAPADQTPTAEFYNAHHQLLYQERLPAGIRRINPATRRALDGFLLKLTRHQLLTTTYLTSLPETIEVNVSAPASPRAGELRHVVFRKGTAVLSVEPVLSPSGSLVVSCAQSANRWLWVTLEDADHQQLFERRFNTGLSKSRLNLTQLPSGHYYLKAGSTARPAIYRLLIDQFNQHYSLQNECQ